MSKNFNKISTGSNIVLNSFFLFYTALCVFPFLLILAVSFSDENLVLLHGYRLIPEQFSTYAYRYLFTTSQALVRSYGITIFVTVAGSVLSVLCITMFAYPLSKKDFKYRNFFSFFVFFTMIFNGGLVPWYMVYTRMLDLKNTLWIYIIPSLMNAWNVIVMRTFISTSLPDSILEAAKIDGASELLIFVRIVLPLSLPGLATIGLFTAINYWNDWYTPLVFISKNNLYNLQYSMYSALRNVQYLEENANAIASANVSVTNVPVETIRMAMCIASIGPIIFAYPFFQKYFIKGLTVGAIKG